MIADTGIQDRLLGLESVAEMLGLSRRQVYRLIAGGELPRPVKQGSRSVLFLSDVETYMDSLRRQRKD